MLICSLKLAKNTQLWIESTSIYLFFNMLSGSVWSMRNWKEKIVFQKKTETSSHRLQSSEEMPPTASAYYKYVSYNMYVSIYRYMICLQRTIFHQLERKSYRNCKDTSCHPTISIPTIDVCVSSFMSQVTLKVPRLPWWHSRAKLSTRVRHLKEVHPWVSGAIHGCRFVKWWWVFTCCHTKK